VFPPSAEVPVISETVPVVAGDAIKVDYSLGLSAVSTADWTIAVEYRLYRNGTLINTRTFSRDGSTATTQIFPMSNTYVDLATLTTFHTYELRVIVTASTNISSASATQRDINMIVFT
jgi:hypothetical protein